MKVKKIFRASRELITATHRYPMPSAVHIATAHKWIHTALHTMCPLPSILLDPPLYTIQSWWLLIIYIVPWIHMKPFWCRSYEV